ncbi:hypothetical protein GALMADRAFT_230539 [Galerina marginata CBS 339.88]|uniref:Pinin/SDK/MemA protein domain-containing protein n=1 Tax=Galerina marginata (strain CBS 339.88) TaxID=685588 RepID=A0A067SG78_GALM3|nr:hypothetical protein GALMADRAFT_230539 [Galerina marginata CBS 339.88]
MSSEEVPAADTQVDTAEAPKSPTEPTSTAHDTKKRPRLDFSAAAGGRERKRGKSMFGILVGTLNKAKIEDKERNASDAAKKRQLIEQRLQAKLRKETDSVRRAEDAKKDKTSANRKEEDLQLKDSIYKLRRTRLPILANFLLTSDVITSDEPSSPTTTNPLAPVPRSHPPPLYYLPAVLTPAQETFLSKRKAEVTEAAEKEWELFREERSSGIEEISLLRQRVAEEDARRKNDKALLKDETMDTDAPSHNDKPHPSATAEDSAAKNEPKDVDMDVDDAPGSTKEEQKSSGAAAEGEKKEESAAMQGDDDDAVEY